MRITHQMMARSILKGVLNNHSELLKSQEKVSTGKIFNRPSDDPSKVGQVLDYKKSLSQIDQYESNILLGKSHLERKETVFATVDELLHEARNLAIDLAGGNSDQDQRNQSIEFVENVFSQMMDLANTRERGQYIFSGHKSTTPPYVADVNYNVTWQGDQGDVRIIIGQGSDISLNAEGRKAFEVDGVEIFDMLKDLREGIQNNDTTAIADLVTQLSGAIDHVESIRVESSVRYQQLDTADHHLQQLELNIKNQLSGATDADMAEAVIELKAQEIAYEASLASSAKIIQKSLMDFLR